MATVTVYSRPGCGLCEEMKAELESLGAAVEEVDVDSNRELKRRYGWDIPVAMLDGEIIAKHRLDAHARAAVRRYTGSP